MKKRVPQQFWDIFYQSIIHAEELAQLEELRRQLNRLKNSGYADYKKARFLEDQIDQKRRELCAEK